MIIFASLVINISLFQSLCFESKIPPSPGIFVENASAFSKEDKDNYVVRHVLSLFKKSHQEGHLNENLGSLKCHNVGRKDRLEICDT